MMKVQNTRFGVWPLVVWVFGAVVAPLCAQEVGIGTTTPAARLDIQALAAYTGDLFRVLHGTNTHMIVKNNGNVGIGTTAPAYRLHVANDGMIYAEGTYNSGTDIPTGAKTAFIWNPKKAAIRAGRVTGSQWDPVNVGGYSVAFGYDGIAGGGYSTVSGGYQNIASGSYGTIGGGYQNRVYKHHGTIGGGYRNRVGDPIFLSSVGQYSTVSGGYQNKAYGSYGTIGGGGNNSVGIFSIHASAVGQYQTVSGGQNNGAYRSWSTVGGGRGNSTNGYYSTVSGGRDNTAGGHYSTVSGGQDNTAGGDYSWAGGRGMNLGPGADRTFAWGYNSTASPPTITTSDAFLIGPNGNTIKVGIGLASPFFQLHLSLNSAAKPISSGWIVVSDARLKKDVLDYTEGLSVIEKIHPVWFSYTGEAGMPTDERGVGVLAQELQEVAPYMVSEWTYTDPKTHEKTNYLAVDNGAMTYMLINAVKELKKTNEEQQATIKELTQRLGAVEALLNGQSRKK